MEICKSNYKLKLHRKIIRSLQPIKYYYGVVAFDTATKTNYYWNILMYTINFILTRTG